MTVIPAGERTDLDENMYKRKEKGVRLEVSFKTKL